MKKDTGISIKNDCDNLDRIMALNAANQLIESLELPTTPKIGEALCMAFLNGCSATRQLTGKVRQKMWEQNREVIEQIFGKQQSFDIGNIHQA